MAQLLIEWSENENYFPALRRADHPRGHRLERGEGQLLPQDHRHLSLNRADHPLANRRTMVAA
ncbi:hypothetical protein [Amycolatopsis sp. NPDC004079]|uniref:hypothetical protein n=1 Tax=Amycolatopsis sp. NPDC004079 TaxID=3154549 RepID=UPI0033A61E63